MVKNEIRIKLKKKSVASPKRLEIVTLFRIKDLKNEVLNKSNVTFSGTDDFLFSQAEELLLALWMKNPVLKRSYNNTNVKDVKRYRTQKKSESNLNTTAWLQHQN